MTINLFACDLQGSPIPTDTRSILRWLGFSTHTQGREFSAKVQRGGLKLPDNVSCEFFRITDKQVVCPCVFVVLLGPLHIHNYSDIGKARIYRQIDPILNIVADLIGIDYEKTEVRHMVTGETLYELYGDLASFNNYMASRSRKLIKAT